MSTQSENSLMKKTKKELCEIIFRKDDVETKLRKEKADIELDFNKAKDMIAKRDSNIDNLNSTIKDKNKQLEDFKDTIDDLVSENFVYKHQRKAFIGITIASVVVAIGAIIFAFIF